MQDFEAFSVLLTLVNSLGQACSLWSISHCHRDRTDWTYFSLDWLPTFTVAESQARSQGSSYLGWALLPDSELC